LFLIVIVLRETSPSAFSVPKLRDDGVTSMLGTSIGDPDGSS